MARVENTSSTTSATARGQRNILTHIIAAEHHQSRDGTCHEKFWHSLPSPILVLKLPSPAGLYRARNPLSCALSQALSRLMHSFHCKFTVYRCSNNFIKIQPRIMSAGPTIFTKTKNFTSTTMPVCLLVHKRKTSNPRGELFHYLAPTAGAGCCCFFSLYTQPHAYASAVAAAYSSSWWCSLKKLDPSDEEAEAGKVPLAVCMYVYTRSKQ